ncbi:hypothetical protein HYS97_01345 [Candidatus Daviesbacteria bacterium]|nr:hypothetical protein [Candidatus Daviesbacteria bacterium]
MARDEIIISEKIKKTEEHSLLDDLRPRFEDFQLFGTPSSEYGKLNQKEETETSINLSHLNNLAEIADRFQANREQITEEQRSGLHQSLRDNAGRLVRTERFG